MWVLFTKWIAGAICAHVTGLIGWHLICESIAPTSRGIAAITRPGTRANVRNLNDLCERVRILGFADANNVHVDPIWDGPWSFAAVVAAACIVAPLGPAITLFIVGDADTVIQIYVIIFLLRTLWFSPLSFSIYATLAMAHRYPQLYHEAQRFAVCALVTLTTINLVERRAVQRLRSVSYTFNYSQPPEGANSGSI